MFDFVTVIGSISDAVIQETLVCVANFFFRKIDHSIVAMKILGFRLQHRFSQIVSRRSFNQITTTRCHHSYAPVDLCTIIQSPPLRLLTDSDAVLHLRHYWDAGKWKIYSILNDFTRLPFNFLSLHTNKMFGNIAISDERSINRHNNFQSFIQGLMLLFRCVEFIFDLLSFDGLICLSSLFSQLCYGRSMAEYNVRLSEAAKMSVGLLPERNNRSECIEKRR